MKHAGLIGRTNRAANANNQALACTVLDICYTYDANHWCPNTDVCNYDFKTACPLSDWCNADVS